MAPSSQMYRCGDEGKDNWEETVFAVFAIVKQTNITSNERLFTQFYPSLSNRIQTAGAGTWDSLQ